MDIKIGDTVSFTLVGGSRSVLSMQTKSGVVEAINGQVATIRTSRAKTYDVHFSRLNNPREKTELTRFVEEVFRANREQGRQGYGDIPENVLKEMYDDTVRE